MLKVLGFFCLGTVLMEVADEVDEAGEGMAVLELFYYHSV